MVVVFLMVELVEEQNEEMRQGMYLIMQDEEVANLVEEQETIRDL